ncbi:MAG: MFS transporter [Firmicutes bacterium]|nr:MFS transporter [Alicyclobacillaceae bacterium]MCL6498199.1 MFS transporter [Bacillota bacterium]
MATQAVAQEGVFTAENRGPVAAGLVSMILQTYDISLPALVLPAAITYFIPATLPPVVQATIVTLTGVVSTLGNPVGGVGLAPFADRVGRRTLMLITNIGYTVIAAAIALLPGYAAWGYWSIGLLLFLRFCNGVFAASSPAGAIPMALERTSKRARGIIGAVLGIGPTCGVLLLSLIQNGSLGIAGTPAAFVQWGWRLPFWFGALLGIVETFLTLRTHDLDYFTQQQQQPTHRRRFTLVEVFSRKNIGIFAQTMIMYLGFLFLAVNIPVFIPTLFITYLHQPPAEITTVLTLGSIGVLILALVLGAWAQRIGRRRGLIIGGLTTLVIVTPLFGWMIFAGSHHGSPATILILGTLVDAIGLSFYSGIGLTYLTERYPLDIRAAGFGAVYSLSTIIPGFSSFYLLALRAFMPYQYTVLVLVAIAGVLVTWGAWAGPETKDFDMLTPANPS